MADKKLVQVVIPMKPVAKERPRAGMGHVYTPRKTKEAERIIGYTVKSCMKASCIPMFEKEALRVTVEFTFATPDKKKQDTPKRTRPDIDNLGKTVLDALNGVAFKDDGQVSEFLCFKRFAAEDGITIKIESLQQAA